jgi:hypothetical protein
VASATAVGRALKNKGADPPTGRSRNRRPNPNDKSKGQRLHQGGVASKGAGKTQPSNGISPEERECCKAEGRCFVCGELGHVSWQCSKNTHLKSDSPGKPPGIPSFRVHVGLSDEDRLRQLAEVLEPPNDLFVGSVGVWMEEPFEIPPIIPEEDEPSV